MRTLTFTAILAFATASLAAPVPKEIKRSDPERFQGVWVYGSYDFGGTPGAGGRWHFTGDKLFSGGDGSGPVAEYGFVLRPDRSPREIDITQKDAVTCLGIYKFEGGELHIAYTHTGGRPTDHAPAAGKSLIVLTPSSESTK